MLLYFLNTPKALSLELQPIQGILISFTLFHTMPEIKIACDYLAPDIIPQGKIQARFSIDFGTKINFKLFIILREKHE
ncbi:MAG: hypothetical protein ACI9KR_000704 [Arcticibacterium sp.]|jgi:hypothetical protein